MSEPSTVLRPPALPPSNSHNPIKRALSCSHFFKSWNRGLSSLSEVVETRLELGSVLSHLCSQPCQRMLHHTSPSDSWAEVGILNTYSRANHRCPVLGVLPYWWGLLDERRRSASMEHVLHVFQNGACLLQQYKPSVLQEVKSTSFLV